MTESNIPYTEIYGDIFKHFDWRRDGYPIPYMKTPDKFYLVQCISGDRAMGAGLAKDINSRYHFRDRVIGEFARSFAGFKEDGWIFHKNSGTFIRMPLIKSEEGYSVGEKQTIKFDDPVGTVVDSYDVPDILGIVTKKNYYDKPTPADMQKGLDGLKVYIEEELWALDDEDDYTIELIMPTLGCGLDHLDWEMVSEMILNTFTDLMVKGRLMITVVKKDRDFKFKW